MAAVTFQELATEPRFMPLSPAPGLPIRPRILLVEDDDAVRRSLQLLLVSRGYDVRAYRAGDGLAADPEALRAACLVADLIIPDGDGLNLLRELREADWSGPAVLISGHLTDELVSQARALGYAAVLPKPIGETVLVGWLARLLESPRLNSSRS